MKKIVLMIMNVFFLAVNCMNEKAKKINLPKIVDKIANLKGNDNRKKLLALSKKYNSPVFKAIYGLKYGKKYITNTSYEDELQCLCNDVMAITDGKEFDQQAKLRQKIVDNFIRANLTRLF